MLNDLIRIGRISLTVIALTSLVLLTSCAYEPDVIVVSGTSETIPLITGDTVILPAGWSGAWMMSDQALMELLECCDNCVRN